MNARVHLYRNALFLVLPSLLVGCAVPRATITDAALGAEESRNQPIERQPPPFFIFRPGAGLTVEGADGEWSVRL